MLRLVLFLAVALMLPLGSACAQPLARPMQPNFEQPGTFPPSDSVEIHQTIFAVTRDTGLPADPTAPPVIQDAPLATVTEAQMPDGFSPPQGEFTRYRYLATRGERGFGIQSLEWGNDSSSSWWADSWGDDDTRLRISSGFGIHWWAGPKTEIIEAGPHLPSRVYDLYLDVLWQERWNEQFMTDVLISPGLFTDFKTTPPQAFRLRGHAIGLFAVTPEFQLVGGVDYINRDDVKLLPVAGVLWRPDDANRFHLVFPQPKVSHRASTFKDNECWLFVAGEYGGGAWTYKDRTESHDRVEYNDYRLICGIEFVKCGETRPTGQIELGYVFNRELRLGRQTPDFDPKDTFFLGFRCTR